MRSAFPYLMCVVQGLHTCYEGGHNYIWHKPDCTRIDSVAWGKEDHVTPLGFVNTIFSDYLRISLRVGDLNRCLWSYPIEQHRD